MVQFISFAKSFFEILFTKVLGAGELIICFFHRNKIYCIRRKCDKLCHLLHGSFLQPRTEWPFRKRVQITEVFGHLIL